MSEDIKENVEELEEEVVEEEISENEVEKEKQSFFQKLKNPKYTKHKIVLVVLLIACIAGTGIFIYNSLNWTADRICREMVSDKSNLELVVIEDNTNTSISYFRDSTLKIEGLEYTGSIEVFENKTEALLKKDYYELYDTEMMKVFNETTLGSGLVKVYGTGKSSVYVNGNTLIRLSYHYSEYQVNQLIKQFNVVMEQTYQTEKNIPTSNQQDEIIKNYKKQIEEEVASAKNNLITTLQEDLNQLKAEIENADIDRLLEIKDEAASYKTMTDLALLALEVEEAVDTKIQSQVVAVDTILDEAENTYSRDKVQDAKDAIALLTHEVFNEYKDPWNDRIELILYKIKEKEIQDYKDQCTEYNYYDIDESYDGKYAYFYGKIMSISTNTNGRIALVVNVTPQYLFGQIAYWSNSVYVDVDEGISAFYDQGDMIQMWGTLEGMVTNEQVFGDAKNYPEFYCQYASE